MFDKGTECYHTKNDVKALEWFKQAAAQYNLGRLYFNGQGVTLDQAESARWYKKAIEQRF